MNSAAHGQHSPLLSQVSLDLSGLVGICDSSSTGMVNPDPIWQLDTRPQEPSTTPHAQPQWNQVTDPTAATTSSDVTFGRQILTPKPEPQQQGRENPCKAVQMTQSPPSHGGVATAVETSWQLHAASEMTTAPHVSMDTTHASLQTQHGTHGTQVQSCTVQPEATTVDMSGQQAADTMTAAPAASEPERALAAAAATHGALQGAAAAPAAAAAAGPALLTCPPVATVTGAMPPALPNPIATDAEASAAALQHSRQVMEGQEDPGQLLTPGNLDAGSRQGSTNAAAASAAVVSAATATEPTEPTDADGDDDDDNKDRGTGGEKEEEEEEEEECGAPAEDSADAADAAAAAAAAASAAAAAAVAITYTGHAGTHICLVDGCSTDLTELKPYFRRSKICPSHQSAPTVPLGGVVCRFCQQCTRCHPLDEFDGTKRSCRSQLAHHNKSRKHRRRCTPGSFYSTKRSKPHAAQAARAKARLLAAQQAAAAAAAAGGDVAAQQAAASAAVAAAAAAAMAEAKTKKVATKTSMKKSASTSAMTAAAAAAAQRAVKTELLQFPSQATAGGSLSEQAMTRRAAAAAAAALEEDLAAAAEVAASAAAAQHHRQAAAAAAALGMAGAYGVGGDVWGRLDHSEVVSGAGAAGGVYSRFAYTSSGLAPNAHALGLDRGSGGYSMAQLQHMQQQQMQMQQMQMQGFGSIGAASLAANSPAALGLGLGSRLQGFALQTVAGVSYSQGGAVSGGAGPLCGSGMLHGRATVSAGSGRMATPQTGEEDAGSSSCCSSRGSPMLNGRRPQRNLLLSSSSAPSGSLVQYLSPIGGVAGGSNMGGLSNMPPLPPHVYTQQQQQHLLAANAAAAAAAGGASAGIVRSSSATSAYAAARAAAVAAAAARNNSSRGWRAMLPAEQALLQAGNNSYDSCADIWSGQAGGGGAMDNSLAPGGAGAGGGSPGGMYLMTKISRSRLDQSPGSTARQAAAMAGYQAVQQQQQQQQQHHHQQQQQQQQHQQQQQELEQLQLWHMLQNSRQAGSVGRTAADLSPLLTHTDLAAATAMQGVPTSQPLFQNCAGEVSSASINAAMAAGIRGSSAAAAAAAAGMPVSHLVVQTVSSMPPSTSNDHYHAQGAPDAGGVSVHPGGADGMKAARDAATAELIAMVNPSDLLGDARAPFDLGWHNLPADAVEPQHIPAQNHAAQGASNPGHAHGQFMQQAGSAHKGMPAAVARGGAAPSSGTAAAAAVAAGGLMPVAGLDAGDMADLWDVLEDYEGGDKESCDALFEHLTDLF